MNLFIYNQYSMFLKIFLVLPMVSLNQTALMQSSFVTKSPRSFFRKQHEADIQPHYETNYSLPLKLLCSSGYLLPSFPRRIILLHSPFITQIEPILDLGKMKNKGYMTKSCKFY